jgi:hypothetical protein
VSSLDAGAGVSLTSASSAEAVTGTVVAAVEIGAGSLPLTFSLSRRRSASGGAAASSNLARPPPRGAALLTPAFSAFDPLSCLTGAPARSFRGSGGNSRPGSAAATDSCGKGSAGGADISKVVAGPRPAGASASAFGSVETSVVAGGSGESGVPASAGTAAATTGAASSAATKGTAGWAGCCIKPASSARNGSPPLSAGVLPAVGADGSKVRVGRISMSGTGLQPLCQGAEQGEFLGFGVFSALGYRAKTRQPGKSCRVPFRRSLGCQSSR